MKKIYSAVLLSLLFSFAFVTLSWASTYTFTPPSPYEDLDDLDHYKYYTWGLNWDVPAGEVVVGANLFFDDIRNYNDSDNDLYVHLLDSVAVGVAIFTDNQGGGDNFAGDGVLLNHWQNLPSTAQDITYNFSAAELVSLSSYLADGNFGFGFDPDCHFYNNGITFTVETAPVPIPGAVWLLGSGMLGLLVVRRKRV